MAQYRADSAEYDPWRSLRDRTDTKESRKQANGHPTLGHIEQKRHDPPEGAERAQNIGGAEIATAMFTQVDSPGKFTDPQREAE